MSRIRSAKLDRLSSTFGKETVTADERQALVTELFDKIAPRYDLMNDLMSFGLHRLWKHQVVGQAARHASAMKGLIVDLAGGTGDIALGIRAELPVSEIVIVDASSGMLEVANRRGGGILELVHAPAEAIPLDNDCASAVTLVFGLRNMTDPAKALREATRILKPGGKLFLLEFSEADAWFRPFYGLHSRFIIPALGALVAKDRRAYSYLVESIRLFPGKDAITRELREAGLVPVSVRGLMFGVAAFHSAEKK